MSLPWISVNRRLLEAVQIINETPTEHYLQILTETSKGPDELPPKYLTDLENTLKLDTNKVQLLVQSIAHIYKKSSKVILKPTVLQKQLTEILHLTEEKAEHFLKVWTEKTKEDFNDLDKRKKLDGVSWELNVETHSSKGIQGIKPKARVQLHMSNFEGCDTENVSLELGEEELLQLYYTLENIQSKLDTINN